MKEQPLDPTSILEREFGYAMQTALQSSEDRARIFGYHLTVTGTLLAAAIAMATDTNIANQPEVAWVLALLFAILTLFGMLSMLQLAKLRMAWRDSVLTMNRIKEYYIRFNQNIKLEKAFRWRTETIPAANKPWTVAFMLALSVIVTSSVTTAAAILAASFALSGQFAITAGAAGGVIAFVVQLVLWFAVLR